MKGTKREARLRFSSKTESLTDLWCFSEWKSPRSIRRMPWKTWFLLLILIHEQVSVPLYWQFEISPWLHSRDTNRKLKQRRGRRQGERQKSNWFRFAKQQLCTCITLFCTFLCRHCTTTTWKCLISRFVELTGTQDNNFPFLFLNFDTVL